MVARGAEAVIAEAISAWDSPLEATLFGTTNPSKILELVNDFCSGVLDQDIRSLSFYSRGVGSVFGVILMDGRRIAVKVHRRELVDHGLEGFRRVQEHLADAGLRAPRPLGDPRPLGHGLAAAEEILGCDSRRSAHDPSVPMKLATGLQRFIEAAAPLLGRVHLPLAHPFGLAAGELWPQPHDLRFDLTLPGGEWIDDMAIAARSALKDPVGQQVIGHADWRIENVRVEEEIVAIYDWDSVCVCREPAMVGANAAAFTADWSDDHVDPYPSLDEMAAFIVDYEVARGRPFTANQRETAEAALLYRLAYLARCEYSDATLGGFPDVDKGWRRLLRTLGGR